ncbi:perilipin-3-like isoform X2 [Chelonoidis abingdonii]|uniref:perilipin-3-like isoform X2 n=1 Tax=Chelonoidis abingdonii TaxID=106734 RepID=UPI0013F209D2|nr:perilipin-3-like isoform X2 [Chelonoidis abingdonii]
MASSDPSAASPKDEEQENIANRVANLPFVSSAYDMVSTAYTSTKESHPYVKSVCDMAEKGMKSMAAAVVSGAQPILSKLEPQISTANEYACRGLDKLEEKLPILQEPTDKIISNTKGLVTATVTGAKDAVSNTMTGMMDMTKGAVQGSVELTRSAVTSGVNTVMGSAVGQMVVSSMGAVLGKSEELVDHYLPMTDEELAKLATPVEGFEMASVEQQKQQQSYFVRLGSLSTKLRQRAYQHSLGKLRHARQSTQEALSQLHQTIELIEHTKQGVDQKLRDGQEKLHQMWLDWSQKQASQSKEMDSVQPEVEEQALVMSRSLTHQLQTTCLTLVSSLQGLPADLQDKAQLVRHHVDELRASFSAAGSFHDLTGSVLAQSRERVTKARKLLDELMDHVVHNVPLSWLVEPFAPSGKQQEEVEMEQCPAD